MTSRNSNWNKLNTPFLLRPVGKDYLWGGNRLNDDFSKGIDKSPLAETWECSTHPSGISVVSSGEYAGKMLNEVLRENPGMMGRHANEKGELPILIKLIDAGKDLSIQVHPDDKYAAVHENGALGKTEMWYVLDAAPGAEIIYGFQKDTSKEEVMKALKDGKLEALLRRVPIAKNRVFYVSPGTIHGISHGALLAEVQESSDITYRLYDYERIDKNGKKRPLHIEKALEVMNYKSTESPKQPIRVLKYTRGCATEILNRCKYFQTERVLINTERIREYMEFSELAETFQVLLCTDGCGVMHAGDTVLDIFKGDCIFVPAGDEVIRLHGMAQFLKVRC
ncbi:MAG: mannose-6-phosphate isomerase, class I [Lachnospiraceae bacterium]|nr:mannose-6-phosphate isomerase, class I [Lachnospiraceae bacterium]